MYSRQFEPLLLAILFSFSLSFSHLGYAPSPPLCTTNGSSEVDRRAICYF